VTFACGGQGPSRAVEPDDDDDEKHTLQKQKTNTSLFNTLIRDAKFPNTR
jgi:hypothetical protein